jgi:aspartate racemase
MDMNKGRCLGLVGGLGVGATIHYYRELARAHEQQARSLDIVIAHAETSRVFDYVQANDRDGLAEYLTTFIWRLKAAGAEAAAIPAVTPHFCVEQLVRTSPLPVFSIFEPLDKELAARAVQRLAVFGTRFVMESALFGFVQGIEIIPAKPDETNHIHATYAELLRQGKGSEEQHKTLTSIAHTLLKRDRVDVIVLAGTDLALVFNSSNTDFPYIDCAALHIEAILNGLLDRVTTDQPTS